MTAASFMPGAGNARILLKSTSLPQPLQTNDRGSGSPASSVPMYARLHVLQQNCTSPGTN
ncbi:MAG: hypothetical protein ACKO4V_07215 [Planctomycetota bacterium]